MEKHIDLAYSYKDLEKEERQSRQKLLRIIRELEKRVDSLEFSLENIKGIDFQKIQRGK